MNTKSNDLIIAAIAHFTALSSLPMFMPPTTVDRMAPECKQYKDMAAAIEQLKLAAESKEAPTLRSICGKRTLDSMDGDEINELLAMLFPTGTRECSIDFREQDGQQAYQITLSDQDYHTWYITIGMGDFSAVCADDSIGGSIHPAKLIRWFIEKGFDVWGDGVNTLPVETHFKEMLERLLGMDTAFPTIDILTRLVDATDKLLHHCSYDGTGWEVLQESMEFAKKRIEAFKQIQKDSIERAARK